MEECVVGLKQNCWSDAQCRGESRMFGALFTFVGHRATDFLDIAKAG